MRIKKAALAAATILGSVMFATSANAGVTVSSVDGASPYGLPATFNFNQATPQYSGALYTGSVSGVRAQPAGSTGGYAAVGPGSTSPSATLDLSAFDLIDTISFLWGSVDTYNTIELLGTGLSFNGGSMGVMPATGDQTAANSNRLVTFTLTGADRANVTGIRFSSTQAAFEFDNVNISAVPEPATWAMMLAGFGFVGASMRRRKQRATIAYA
jgi:hypothetical protein